MARVPGSPRAASAGERRLSKNQRRMLTVLVRIPPAREQLIVAIEDVSPTFELHTLVTAAQSRDARQRNQVDTIERGTEKLINWMEELAARALSEGLALDVVVKGYGRPVAAPGRSRRHRAIRRRPTPRSQGHAKRPRPRPSSRLCVVRCARSTTSDSRFCSAQRHVETTRR